MILTFPAVILLHYLNHAIFDENLSVEKLVNSLSKDNYLTDYVINMSDALSSLEESNPFGEDACPELVYGVDFVATSELHTEELVDSIIELLVVTAELSAETNTNLVKGSKEWEEYLVDFYERLTQK